MIINNKKLPEDIIAELLQDIKSQKYDVDNSYIIEELQKYLSNDPKSLNLLLTKLHKELKRSEKYERIIKAVRSKLRKRIEAFQSNNKLTSLLEKLKTDQSLENHNDLLKTNKSTRERLSFYPIIYEKIFEITGRPKIILDLACGLNPLSFPYMNLKDSRYIAIDINKTVVDVVENYFKIMNVDGIVKQQNVLNLPSLDKVDVCFLFKALDVLELKKGHKFAEKLIRHIPSQYLVASFSTKTMSGKPMNHPQRGWIERLCQRLGYEFKIIKGDNELFYIIHKRTATEQS